jgi:hypothetical protein
VIEDEKETPTEHELSVVNVVDKRVESTVLAHDFDMTLTRTETVDDDEGTLTREETVEDNEGVQSKATENLAQGSCHGMKRRWNGEEIKIFNEKFETNIFTKTMPTAKQLASARNSLVSRSKFQIRARLNNIILGKQKCSK